MTDHSDHNEPPTNGGRSSFSQDSPEVGQADTSLNHAHNVAAPRSPAVEALRRSPVTVTIAVVTVVVWLTQFVPT